MSDVSPIQLSTSATRITAQAEIRLGGGVEGDLATTDTENVTESIALRGTVPAPGGAEGESQLESEGFSPFDAAKEPILASDQSENASPPALWNWALLAELDWKRVHELVRAILHRSGIRMQILRCGQDGSRIAVINPADNTTKAARSLVYLAGWKPQPFSDQLIDLLREEQTAEQAGKTVVIQPFVASLETHRIARTKGIELVDAARLLSMISSLPLDESHYLLELFTTGNYRTPTCPICLQSMEQRTRTEAMQQGDPDRDFVPTKSGTMSADFICKHLLIGSHLEWRFAGRLRAESMHILGRVHGDSICLGKFRLGSKAEFNGSIIAHSVEVCDGGLLNGACSILNGAELQKHWKPTESAMVWSCGNFPKCRGMLELR
jgi:hypothetical protein